MESPPSLGSSTPRIAHLCDVVLDHLRRFGETSVGADDTVKAFRSEIQIFRRFLDLIERIRRANPPRMPFEEEHSNDVKNILDRCRGTLSRLCELLADVTAKKPETAPSGSSRELLWNMKEPEIVALRTRIGFYTQTLEMSLQTVKL